MSSITAKTFRSLLLAAGLICAVSVNAQVPNTTLGNVPIGGGGGAGESGRTVSVTIAPYDAPAYKQASADVVLSGNCDETVINSYVGTNGTLTAAGTVRLLDGTINICSPILVDQDWITIQGEGKTHWSAWQGAYPIHALVGLPGGAKIVQTVSGQDGLHIGTTTANMHGDTRHKGLAFRDLYFWGLNYNSYGIFDNTNSADISEISEDTFQGWNNAILVDWDTPQILYNNIQDNAGNGVMVNRYYALIEGNIIFDNGGTGVYSQGLMDRIYHNIIGDLANGIGIYAGGTQVAIVANTINAVPNGQGIWYTYITSPNGSHGVLGNCTINDNIIALYSNGAPNNSKNTAYDGIAIGQSGHVVPGCTVNGNVIGNAATIGNLSTGYAINLTYASSTTAVGNSINGSVWNSNTVPNVLPGNANFVGFNAGQTWAAPTLSSCGTSTLSTNSNNYAGTITFAGSPASCTLTFANTGFKTWDQYSATFGTASVAGSYSFNLTSITFTATALTGTVTYQGTGE